MDAADHVAEVIRLEGTRILATLVRVTGDWSVAEVAVQEAAIAALSDWAANGRPDQPRAWLIATGRRKAIDILRRERQRTGKERMGSELWALSQPDPPDEAEVSGLTDDLLRLIFTCCHPALAPEARLALALRTLCQLTTAEVAAVLLTTEAAMAKRLTRTRQKIAVAHIPYRVPDDADLPARLATVCGVIHALYTAGHAPADGDGATRPDLCAEGLRLARLLHELMPDEAMPAGLLALILLTEARRPARTDPAGDVVPLADQDRTRWDRTMIAEGTELLHESLRRTEGMADPYQLQAAIAAEHDHAPSYPTTDWTEILRLYDLLLSVAPSQPAALARAVVVAERDGPDVGLRVLDDLTSGPRLEAVRSELLARSERYAEALGAVELALVGSLTTPERRYREDQRDEWRRLVSPRSGPAPGRT